MHFSKTEKQLQLILVNMEAELLNCIADALNLSSKDGDFVIRMSSTPDRKFPIFTVYTVVVQDLASSFNMTRSKRVHSKDTDEHTVKRGLVAEVLSELFCLSAAGMFNINTDEFKTLAT